MTNPWWTDVPAVIGASAAAVSAIFAVLIWVVYRGQWKSMAEQAQYMRDGLAETRKAADAAKDGAMTAARTLVMANRPKLLVRPIEVDGFSGRRILERLHNGRA